MLLGGPQPEPRVVAGRIGHGERRAGHWNVKRQAVEFGVEIVEYRGVVRVPRCVFQRLLPEQPTPEQCVAAYYLQRAQFESVQRQLTEDGNVEISGRDLGRVWVRQRSAGGGR
jgi:hypothetical protein